jgi:hypothetical protein
MRTKYQVFVSSTYTDLVDERQDTLKSILDLAHIPVGMEGFFAADEEQLSYIKKIIDECDYYILIIAGRYGSVDDTGVSYTEKEYDYAVEKGVTVLAFIHNDIDNLPAGQVDAEPAVKERLALFRERVSKRRLVSWWSNRTGLNSNIIISLSKAIGEAPAIGWVRGNTVANEDILSQAIALRQELDNLKTENDRLKAQLTPQVLNLAPLTDTYNIKFSFWDPRTSTRTRTELNFPWDTIFVTVGPAFFVQGTNNNVAFRIISLLGERIPYGENFVVHASCLATIKIQLIALGFLETFEAETVGGGIAEFLKLTDLGRRMLIEITAVRAASA